MPRALLLVACLALGCADEDALLGPDAARAARDLSPVTRPLDATVPDVAARAPLDADALPDGAPPPPPDAAAPDAAQDANAAEVCRGAAPAPGRWRIRHGGRERSFWVHLPAGYDPARPTPAVLNFHGRGVNAESQQLLSGMNALADAEGFIAVHPESANRDLTWNAGLCCGAAQSQGVDDVGFAAALLDALSESLCVDPARVFATGLSNGGFLAHRLACERADRLAAIGPVAGPLAVLDCAPARPVSVIHFHGTADLVVPYEGFAGFVGVPATMRAWVAANGCAPDSEVVFAEADVRCEAWRGCRAGVEVELCTIEGGGHTWPGGPPVPFLGETTQTLSASARMWRFFEAHPQR